MTRIEELEYAQNDEGMIPPSRFLSILRFFIDPKTSPREDGIVPVIWFFCKYNCLIALNFPKCEGMFLPIEFAFIAK